MAAPAIFNEDPRIIKTPLAGGGLWYHLTGLKLEEDGHIIAALTGDDTLSSLLLEWHPRPYTLHKDDDLALIMKAPNFVPGRAVEDMIALRVLVKEETVYSFSLSPLQSVAECQEQAASHQLTRDGLIVRLAHTITSKLRHTVAHMLEELDTLEDKVLDPAITVPMKDLLLFRRKIIGFKRSCGPQSTMMLEISEDETSPLGTQARGAFEQIANSSLKIDEILDTMRLRAESVAQMIEADSRRKTERSSYLLALAAGIFLPINLMAGMFGANVGGVPFMEDERGFIIFCGLMVALTVVSWLLSATVLKWINKQDK